MSDRPGAETGPGRNDLVGVLTVVGLAGVTGSYVMKDLGWISGFLLEAGVSVLLLAPLLWVTRRLQGSVATTRRDVDALSERVEETRAEFARTSEELSQKVAARFAAERRRDEDVFEVLRGAPSREDMVVALHLALDRQWITYRGIRASLFDTYFHLRYVLVNNRDLMLRVEWIDGQLLFEQEWLPDQSIIDVFELVGKQLRELGHFPGEVAYQPGSTLEEVADTLVFASQSRLLGDEVRRLFQGIERDWYVTDFDVFHRRPNYQITLQRLDESDWDDHMRGKDWVDITNWRMAMDIGRAMRDGAFDGDASAHAAEA
jgi:hypothetical protein